MRYAIVASGGKQYIAREGETLEVDRLATPPGESFEFSEVLLAADGEHVLIGAPVVAGVSVRAKVLGEVKGDKIVVFRYQPKKRRRRKLGHRQTYSQLVVESIELPGVERKAQGAAPSAKRAAPRKKAAAAKKSAAPKGQTAGRGAAGKSRKKGS